MTQNFTRIITTLLLVFFSVMVYGQKGQIRGKVLASTGEPLAGATVIVLEASKGVFSNGEGIFSINKLESGSYNVICTYLGYDTTQKVIEIRKDQTKTITLVMRQKDVYTNEVLIQGVQDTRIEKAKVEVGVTKVTAKKISLIPSLGSPDLAQYLQVLPGVVFTGDQGGQLYIRGGTPIQNMVLLDGMVVYSPFHSIGLFSVFDTDYIRDVDVASAGFPAQYGGRVSSVIDISTRSGNLKNHKAKLSLSPFSAGTLLEGPLLRFKGDELGGITYLLSVRGNFLDRTGDKIYPYLSEGAEGLPYNFLDIYGKVTISDGSNRFNLFGFRHEDNVNLEFPADIGWQAYGAGGNFQVLPSGAGAIINGFFSFSNYQSGLRSESETFPRESAVGGFNGGLEISYIVNSIDEFAFGLNLLGFTTDYTFTNSFGFQSDQQSNNTEASLYARYKKVFLGKRANPKSAADSTIERFVLEPGAHIHYYNNQSFVSFEPRLRGKLNFDKLSLSFASGLYAQNLLSASSDRDVVNLFQGFLSAPDGLPDRIKNHNLQTARHLLGGVEWEIMPSMKFTVESWVKDFTQLTNINRDKIFPEEADFITETGLAYGFDGILNYDRNNLYIYATYGWAKVTRTDSRRTYAPVFDRRHNINFVTAYRLGSLGDLSKEDLEAGVRPKFNDPKWEFSLRWAMGSGFPFTQTQGYFEKIDFLDNGAQSNYQTQNGNLGLILSDELNGGRLPYYHRLDLSVKRKWALRNQIKLEASFNLINTYNRDNIFYFDRVRFEAVYQLPVLPSLGLSISY